MPKTLSKTAAELTHIKDLTPDPENRRQHNPRNLGMVSDALRRVGAARSIVIDEDGTVLAGNGVLEAAAEAGIHTVQIVEADGSSLVAVRRRGLSPEQKRDLAISDNRTAELAEWNAEQLAADVEAGLDLAPWFSADELAGVLAHHTKTGLSDGDVVPDVRATGIVRGDLFELGHQRLLCGDSTHPSDTARLMADTRASLVFTSPPYGQQRDYKQGVSDWTKLMVGVFSNLPTDKTTQVLVNLGLIHRDGEWIPYWDEWIVWMREQDWRRFGWYVWDQGSGLPGAWNGRLAPSHEFVFHFNQTGRQPIKFVDKKPDNIKPRGGTGLRSKDGTMQGLLSPELQYQLTKIPDSVLRITRHMARGIETEHPAVFPVELPLFAMRCWPGLTFDPFCGSGSTLIAAEQNTSKACGIEIEPSYCQVAIDRWEAFTGQRAVKVGEAVRA